MKLKTDVTWELWYSDVLKENKRFSTRRYQLEQAVKKDNLCQLGYLCKSVFVPELEQAVKEENLSLSIRVLM